MISDKLNLLCVSSGKKQRDIAGDFNIIPQQFNRKIKRSSFKVSELIQLAEFTGTQLAFLDKEGNPVVIFHTDDLPQEKQ